MEKYKNKTKICKCCKIRSATALFKSIPTCSSCCSNLVKYSKKLIPPTNENYIRILNLAYKKENKFLNGLR